MAFDGLGGPPGTPPGLSLGGGDFYSDTRTIGGGGVSDGSGALPGNCWSSGPLDGVVGIGATEDPWLGQNDAEVSVPSGSGVGGSDLRSQIIARIGDQVKQLLLQAKRDSEAKVKSELRAINETMRDLDGALDLMLSQLTQLENAPKDESVEHHSVAKALAGVEQVWGKELGKLKQELHQTIFAHNHNADLMKQQKEALDRLRAEVDAQKPLFSERRRAQLPKLEALIKGQQKQRKLDPFFQRIIALEQRCAAAWRWPAGAPPGGGPPGIAPAAGVGGSSVAATAMAAARGTGTAALASAAALAADADAAGVPFPQPPATVGTVAPSAGRGGGSGCGGAVAVISGGSGGGGKSGGGGTSKGGAAAPAPKATPPALGGATEFSSLNASEALANAVAAALAQASNAASAR